MACKCGSEYIVNKRYNLCQNCNHLRLHGESKFTTDLRKAHDTIKLERKPLKTKQKRIDHSISNCTRERRKVVLQKDEETYLKVFQNKPHECEECGAPLPDQFYSDEVDFCGNEKRINCIGQYSHILSKGSHPEFRHHVKNFNRLCPNPCHDRWEFHDKENMKIYPKNQIIIQELYNERNGSTR